LDPHRGRKDVGKAHRLASGWIAGLQNLETDGGFFFHPEGKHLGNKAGWSDREQTRARSYGTCTADGLVALALLSARREQKTDRIEAAATWLAREAGVDAVPGFGFAPPEKGWEQGLRYYYLMALSSAITHFPDSKAFDLRKRTIAALVAEMNSGRYWKNESAKMREDDPIIATCFALTTLGRLSGLTPP
jgi:hypothetical protein